MIRVMQVSTDTNIGGAGIWLLTFLKYYDREKIDMTVVIPKDSALAERISELDIRYIEADGISDCSFSKEGIKALKEIFLREEPDIIHTHASLSARIAARICKIPIVNTRHCLEPAKKGIKRTIYRMINNHLSDRVVAVSKAVYDNLCEDGIKPEKLALIYNGVEPIREFSPAERQQARERLGLSDNMVVGIFARLEPVKNHHLFLEAAAAAYAVDERFRFIIVGSGSLEDRLKAEAKARGLGDAVIFTGFLRDVSEMMNIADIHVLTSDFEAMSISLVEGMSIAKPCITTDSGGPREVVENGKSGIVVPVGDAVNLSAAILRLASDSALRQSFAEAGRIIASEKFAPEIMAYKLLDLYTGLVGEEI